MLREEGLLQKVSIYLLILKKTIGMFMNNVVTIVQRAIYAEVTLNWDQTCIRLVPSLAWTVEKQGPRQVKIDGVKDKQ